MKSLHYDDLDIVGFAGVRERILVMDSRQFGYRRREECWEGVGPLTYLAHAYFKPGGSTGKHFHEGVDIVSILTRGQIRHEGSAGYDDDVLSGQVIVQRSGKTGFSHNEINADPDVSGMVQIWLKPSTVPEASSLDIITPVTGENLIYDGGDSKLIVTLLIQGQSLMLPAGSLGYVYHGKFCTSEHTDLTRGTLFISDGQPLTAIGEDVRVVSVIKDDAE